MQKSPHILSRDEVARLRRLHQAGERHHQARFLAEGRRTIDGLLHGGLTARHIMHGPDRPIPRHWPGELLIKTTSPVLAKLSQLATPPGYCAEFDLPEARPVDPASGGLMLVGVADPGNTGTLLRCAQACGLTQVVLVGGADPWSAKVVQASAGALATLRPLRLDRLPDWPTADSAPWLALLARGGTGPARLAQRPRWILVGNEAEGLDDATCARCHEQLTLPMPGGGESLNAAIAGALAMFLSQGLHRHL